MATEQGKDVPSISEPKKDAGPQDKAKGNSAQAAGNKRKAQDAKDKQEKEKNKRRKADKPPSSTVIRFRLLCHEAQAGAVIGKGGDTVRHIRKSSGAEVNVLPPVQGQRLRVVVIESQAGNRGQPTCPAKEALLAVATLAVQGDQPLHAPDPSKMVEVRLLVHADLAAGMLSIQGPRNGPTVGDIAARSGANVILPPDSDRPRLVEQHEEYLLFRGPWPNVYTALNLVADEVRRCYFDFRDGPVHPGPVPGPGPYGFPGVPQLGMVPGPYDPIDAMQLGIGMAAVEMAMEMAAASVAGPMGPGGPIPVGGGGGGMAPDCGLSIAGLIPEIQNAAEASKVIKVQFKLVLPESQAGKFIGKGGENLRESRQALRVHTLVIHPAVKGTGVRVLETSSAEAAASSYCAAIEAVLFYVKRLSQAPPSGSNKRFMVRMLMPYQQCGAIVGPRGAIIRQVSVMTRTACVMHKKGDAPAYASADEQELEAEGDPADVLQAIRIFATLVRGYEMRQQGIIVRETLGTPDFQARFMGSGSGAAAGPGPVPAIAPGPMGPMVSALSGPGPRASGGPEDGSGDWTGGNAGGPPPSQQTAPQQMQQQQMQQQQHPQQQGPGGPGSQGARPQQQQQSQPQGGGGVGGGGPAAPSDGKGVGSSGNPPVFGLPPLGPNDVRLTIFVASELVNSAEGINGTNVQQVQTVTHTVVTLRQPVARGDYELDITGTLSEVMQAHALLTNIMSIGAILQGKPHLAPQQLNPSGAGAPAAQQLAVPSVGAAAAVNATSPAAASASGAPQQQQVVVSQPAQGLVLSPQQQRQQQQQQPQQPQMQQPQMQQPQMQQPGGVAPPPGVLPQQAPGQAVPAGGQGQPRPAAGPAISSPQQQQPQTLQPAQQPQQPQQQRPQYPAAQQQQSVPAAAQPTQQQAPPPRQPQQQPQQQPVQGQYPSAQYSQQTMYAQAQGQASTASTAPGAGQVTPPAQQQQQQQPVAQYGQPPAGHGQPQAAQQPYQQQQQQQQGGYAVQQHQPQTQQATQAPQYQPQQYAQAPVQQPQVQPAQQAATPPPQGQQHQQQQYYQQQAAAVQSQQQPQAPGAGQPAASYSQYGTQYGSGYGTAAAQPQSQSAPPHAAPATPAATPAPAAAAATAPTLYNAYYGAPAAATAATQPDATVAPAAAAAAPPASAPLPAASYAAAPQNAAYGAAGYYQAAAPQPTSQEQYYMQLQQYAAMQQYQAAAAAASAPYAGAYGYGYGAPPPAQ